MIQGRGDYISVGAVGEDGRRVVSFIMRADCHVRDMAGRPVLCAYTYAAERPVYWTTRRMMEQTARVWGAGDD